MEFIDTPPGIRRVVVGPVMKDMSHIQPHRERGLVAQPESRPGTVQAGLIQLVGRAEVAAQGSGVIEREKAQAAIGQSPRLAVVRRVDLDGGLIALVV